MASTVVVDQGYSCRISISIFDEDDTPIPQESIATARMTLYDYDTRQVIGTFSGVDLLPYVTASGTAEYHIRGSYNTVVDEDKVVERHILYLVISGVGANAPEIRKEYPIDVRNTRFYEE